MKSKIRPFIIVMLAIMLFLQQWSEAGAMSEDQTTKIANIGEQHEHTAEETASWIIKWRDGEIDRALLDDADMIREQESFNISVVKLKEGVSIKAWLARAEQSEHVAYVQPNQQVSILKKPNDTYYKDQQHLKQIQVETAWEQFTGNTDIIIGVVDTGVDLKHPDLKDNLVSGINLVSDSAVPQDDNGHGTNVAGVIAAAGNNNKGTSGILWNARIMPIKALDDQGSGDEDNLGEGILYAVNHGAKIVVLSVGLYRYSHYMEDIVKYAEGKGVLLVAASGNDAEDLGERVAVKYPAAYPFVLAVGGSANQKTAELRSNYGPEIDVVAPWKVYTTALGGGYSSEEGTSLAAPQVAAVAALIWAKYPDFEPYQIRNLIRQSALDASGKGWNQKTGYGFLRVDRALTMQPKDDIYKPNNSRELAKPFPIDTAFSATLAGRDEGWFYVDAPYNGSLTLQYQALEGRGGTQLSYFEGNKAEGKTIPLPTGSKVKIPVAKGKNYIQLELKDKKGKEKITYLLSSKFNVYQDRYVKNNSADHAYKLPARSQEIIGTFSREAEEDWFSFQVHNKGTLKLKLSSDSVRIDPAMEIRGDSIDKITVDAFGEEKGDSESITIPDLEQGQYFIRVYNAISPKPSPVAAEYKLSLDYITQYTDPNEPNDKSYQAVTVAMDNDYLGVFSSDNDNDWFQFRLKERSYVVLSVGSIPSNRKVRMQAYDRKQKELFSLTNQLGETSLRSNRILEPGNYFIKLTTNKKFDQQYYLFKVHAEPMVSGFRDISGHWAEKSIIALTQRKWIGGYSDYRFEPERGITRAEAVAVLNRAFQWKAGKTVHLLDVSPKHWAYDAIQKAVSGGIISGYQDQTFAPNRFVTRAEMAVMIGNSMHIKPKSSANRPFVDVADGYWAAPMLMQMKNQGLIGGFQDGTFKPEDAASRADFTAMLYNIVLKK